MEKYSVKVDDILMHLLKEHYNISASEALVFFDDRVQEMKQYEANVNEKSMKSFVKYKDTDKRTGHGKFGNGFYQVDEEQKYYVLRGFYPETNLPFKITAVYGKKAHRRMAGKVIHVKVMMGMKPHWTSVSNLDIETYRDHEVEKIILGDHEPMLENKVEYKYRNYKCMKPKGMQFYREKGYEDKQKEMRKLATKKRKLRKAKNE